MDSNKRKFDDITTLNPRTTNETGESTEDGSTNQAESGTDVITIRQGENSFSVQRANITKFPSSFIATMIDSQFLEGGQTDITVKGRNPDYFKYIAQMYEEAVVSLATEENKDHFLVEYGFWFPGESTYLVRYKDIIVELEWKTDTALKAVARNAIHDLTFYMETIADRGVFGRMFNLKRYKELSGREDVLAQVALRRGIVVQKLPKKWEYYFSWKSEGALYDKAWNSCNKQIKMYWDILLEKAEQAAALGSSLCRHEMRKHEYCILENNLVLEAFRNLIRTKTEKSFELNYENEILEFSWGVIIK